MPLYHGWTGTVFLTTSGEFIFRDEEADPPAIRPETDESTRLISLAIGAEQYELLANLLPERPLHEENCELCAGSGRTRLPNGSSLLCNQCSSLGWLGRIEPTQWKEEISDPKASYVPFDEAISRFMSFASTQGLEGELVFIENSDVAIVRRQMYVRFPNQINAWKRAREAYRVAARNRRGVLIAAACKLPEHRLGVYVYGPRSVSEAVESLFPDGLKLSVPAEPSIAVLVGGLRFQVLRTLQRMVPPPFDVDNLLK